MEPQKRIPESLHELLCCPVCHSRLKLSVETWACENTECASCFPIVDSIPVLINEQSSVFSIEDFISRKPTFFHSPGKSIFKKVIIRLTPAISLNVRGESNYRRLRRELLSRSNSPRVLVIGGSILGHGMKALAGDPAISLVETDVSFGPRTMLICDAHDIPFQDETFDGVVVQAVLEHVVDPHRCCSEIFRVLKKDGLVYSETPFMQPGHAGRHDFTRLTHLGHRRLFRFFEEIDSGPISGQGTALALAYQQFLSGFTASRIPRVLCRTFARFTSFFLKYFDYYLINKPGAYDAASGYYFMGVKSANVLADRELIRLYKGVG